MITRGIKMAKVKVKQTDRSVSDRRSYCAWVGCYAKMEAGRKYYCLKHKDVWPSN
jgi:hypothetical protein